MNESEVRYPIPVTDRLLYRIPEAAQMLGLSYAKTKQLIARGDIHAVKIDGATRIASDELRRFVEFLPRMNGLSS